MKGLNSSGVVVGGANLMTSPFRLSTNLAKFQGMTLDSPVSLL